MTACKCTGPVCDSYDIKHNTNLLNTSKTNINTTPTIPTLEIMRYCHATFVDIASFLNY